MDTELTQAGAVDADADETAASQATRRVALDCAVRTHGPDSLAADVIETANLYNRWLSTVPRRRARTPAPQRRKAASAVNSDSTARSTE